jgi:hypothetical protein
VHTGPSAGECLDYKSLEGLRDHGVFGSHRHSELARGNLGLEPHQDPHSHGHCQEREEKRWVKEDEERDRERRESEGERREENEREGERKRERERE